MVLFAEGNQSVVVLCLAVLAITVSFVLVRTQKNLSRQRQTQRSEPAPPRREPDTEHHLGPNELLRWDVAMHETARDLSAQLDSKAGILQHLIREADRAAARLEAALQATEAAGARSAVAPRPRSQAEALRESLQGENLAGVSLEQETPPAAANDSRYEEIYLLADYGYPASEIAQRLGSPVGEIELILSLRKQRP